MGKIIDEVALDATDTTVYGRVNIRGVRDLLALGYDMVETSATFGTTITLQAEAIPGQGEKEPETPTASATTYDTGWVDLGAAHGWAGFPAGDTTSGDQDDTVSLVDVGHEILRVKVVRISGEGTATIGANTKSRS